MKHRSTQAIRAYLLGSQTNVQLSEVTASEVLHGGMSPDLLDLLLTSVRLKLAMVESGRAGLDSVINFVDDLAIGLAGELTGDDINHPDMQEDIAVMLKQFSFAMPVDQQKRAA